MIHPDIQAMLVRERSATLMAAAAAYRRGRQARSAATEASRAAANRTAPHKTAERGQVVPRDGSAMLIRPVRGADVPLLADGFTRLSERSRWLRFLGRKRTLTEADLRFSPTSTTATTRRSARSTTSAGAAWCTAGPVSPSTKSTWTARAPGPTEGGSVRNAGWRASVVVVVRTRSDG